MDPQDLRLPFLDIFGNFWATEATPWLAHVLEAGMFCPTTFKVFKIIFPSWSLNYLVSPSRVLLVSTLILETGLSTPVPLVLYLNASLF